MDVSSSLSLGGSFPEFGLQGGSPAQGESNDSTRNDCVLKGLSMSLKSKKNLVYKNHLLKE